MFINNLPSYLESTADPVHLNNIDLHCLMYADDFYRNVPKDCKKNLINYRIFVIIGAYQ